MRWVQRHSRCAIVPALIISLTADLRRKNIINTCRDNIGTIGWIRNARSFRRPEKWISIDGNISGKNKIQDVWISCYEHVSARDRIVLELVVTIQCPFCWCTYLCSGARHDNGREWLSDVRDWRQWAIGTIRHYSIAWLSNYKYDITKLADVISAGSILTWQNASERFRHLWVWHHFLRE